MFLHETYFDTILPKFYDAKYGEELVKRMKKSGAKAKDLAGRFIKNFKKYEGNAAGKALVAAGPKL